MFMIYPFDIHIIAWYAEGHGSRVKAGGFTIWVSKRREYIAYLITTQKTRRKWGEKSVVYFSDLNRGFPAT